MSIYRSRKRKPPYPQVYLSTAAAIRAEWQVIDIHCAHLLGEQGRMGHYVIETQQLISKLSWHCSCW
jgi:hypothetical protein